MLQGKKISSQIRQKSESQQKLNEHKIYGARTACTIALNAAMAVGAMVAHLLGCARWHATMSASSSAEKGRPAATPGARCWHQRRRHDRALRPGSAALTPSRFCSPCSRTCSRLPQHGVPALAPRRLLRGQPLGRLVRRRHRCVIVHVHRAALGLETWSAAFSGRAGGFALPFYRLRRRRVSCARCEPAAMQTCMQLE